MVQAVLFYMRHLKTTEEITLDFILTDDFFMSSSISAVFAFTPIAWEFLESTKI